MKAGHRTNAVIAITVRDTAQPARYDDSLGAWVFSRYADVAAALSEPRLSVDGAAAETGAQLALRESARQSFSAERIAHWQRELELSARSFMIGLPAGTGIDLVHEFAQPWALSVAVLVTGARHDQSQHLAGLAHQVFLSAAHSTDGRISDEAKAATAELACGLRAGTDNAIATQAFVAASQTLPCLLAGAWLALLQHPEESARLWNDRGLLPNAVEELLRFAGPARAVFRRAAADVLIAGVQISAGDRVVLLLSAANRDPARFSNPDQLDISRDAAGLLAFGRGPHYCAGAQFMRGALATATRALIEHSAGVEWIGDVSWIDGFAIRGPQTLPVRLTRQ